MGALGVGISPGGELGVPSHQGNLVNYVNAFDMHNLHQLHTSLVPGEVKKSFYTTSLSKDANGKLHKEFTVVSIIQDTDSPKVISQETSESKVMTSGLDNQTVTGDENLHNSSCDISQEEDDGNNLPPPDDFEAWGYSSSEESHPQDTADEPFENEVNDMHPNDTGINNHNQSIKQHTCDHASPELTCLVDLYLLLDKRGVANSLFDEITKWAWLNTHTFGRAPPMKRKVVVDKVSRHVHGPRYKTFMTPRQDILRLSTGRHVALTYFPLEQMIKDMLSNSTLMEKENLLFPNYRIPTEECTVSDEPVPYGEVNSGTWWKKAVRHECKGPRDVLWPLILFIDAMKVDNLSGKLKLEPITFTFSRFKRYVRNQDNAWRTWAFMEDVKQTLHTGEGNCHAMTPKERLQEYHDILSFLMNDLKRIQENGIKWTLDFGEDGQHEVVLRLPLQFIVGDCEGHDKLAGHFKGHTMTIKGLCRDCDIPTTNSDDERWFCRFFTEQEIKNMTEEELRSYSFHNINNGFEGVSCGGCRLGLRGALNPEVLHLFKAGHCEWIFDGFVYSLSSNVSEQTKSVCKFLVNMNRGQSDRQYPFIGTFHDGIIKPQGTNLQGHEKHARLFMIYLMLCCSDFVRVLDANAKRGSEYDISFYSEFILLLETCLGFYEWTMKREHDPNTIIGGDGTVETSVAQISVRYYMFLLKNICPREVMNKNFKMTKFHQTLHLVPLIAHHGSLRNTDSSCPESMAKGNVKDPASHTQRVGSRLSFQTGKRYIESLTFREFKRLRTEMGYETGGSPYISKDTEEYSILHSRQSSNVNDDADLFTGGTKFSISLDVDQPEGQYDVSIVWKCNGATPLRSFDNNLLQSLGRRLFGAKDGGVISDSEVPGFTSLKIDTVTYNAHPLYKNDHAWNDWVYLSWDGYPDPIPARIEMFFDLTNSEIADVDISVTMQRHQNGDDEVDDMAFRHVFLEQTVYAVVWSAQSLTFPAEKDTDYHLPLKLGYRVQLETFRRIIPINAFVRPCYGMLNMCGLNADFDNTAIILHDRAEWSDTFLTQN
jgi:hypothetical protein